MFHGKATGSDTRGEPGLQQTSLVLGQVVSTARGQPLHYREFILLFQLMQLLSHYRGVCVCMCVCLWVCTRTRVHVCVFKLAKCLWLHLSGNWTY